jgi:hypothetical protein
VRQLLALIPYLPYLIDIDQEADRLAYSFGNHAAASIYVNEICGRDLSAALLNQYQGTQKAQRRTQKAQKQIQKALWPDLEQQGHVSSLVLTSSIFVIVKMDEVEHSDLRLQIGLQGQTVNVQRLMVTVCEFDMPPPGPGLKTATLAVPGRLRSVAGRAILNCVLLMKVVGRSDPFQRAIELGMKPVPLTVSVKPELPVKTVFGSRLAMAGAGLLLPAAWLTVKVFPAMVSVPVRALALGLAITE